MEYNIGGKIFLKKGGKYIPKMTDGGYELMQNKIDNFYSPFADEGSQSGEVDSNNLGGKASPSVWKMGLNFAGTTLNSLAKVPNPGSSPRALAASQSYNRNNTINRGGLGLLNAASMIDPTGTASIIAGAVNVGKGLGKLINPGDEYGVAKSTGAEVVSNIIDPLSHFQQSFNIGKKHGFGEGLKNFMTLGATGNELMRRDVAKAKARDAQDDMMMRQGMNQGDYRNDGIYAKFGARITPKHSSALEQNVEIEDGEIVLGDPTQMGIQGNTSTSLESKYGAMFHGDKHGQDSDNDGKEGIPLRSGAGYVASNYLGVDGKRASSTNKSVANEMKPYLKFLNGGETNPTNVYKNNPVAIAETNRQIELIKKEAERNKFMEELSKQARNKNRNIKDILSFISENAPLEDMSPEEQMQVGEINNQLNNQNQNQQQMNQPVYRFGGRYFQQGGMTQPEQNPSQDRMSQLIQETPQIQEGQEGQTGQTGGVEGQMSVEAQQVLAQLPPEVQQQIMQLPPQQREAAVMQYARQMQAGAQEAPAPGQGTGPMPEEAMAAEAPMGMEESPEVGMEGTQPVMKCGGRMYRRGDYIRFQRGGRVMEGYISNINPNSNTFSLR